MAFGLNKEFPIDALVKRRDVERASLYEVRNRVQEYLEKPCSECGKSPENAQPLYCPTCQTRGALREAWEEFGDG